jgi:hypothetical protein
MRSIAEKLSLEDVNPNTTFYSYYFFPRALRRVDAVLFLCPKISFAYLYMVICNVIPFCIE